MKSGYAGESTLWYSNMAMEDTLCIADCPVDTTFSS